MTAEGLAADANAGIIARDEANIVAATADPSGMRLLDNMAKGSSPLKIRFILGLSGLPKLWPWRFFKVGPSLQSYARRRGWVWSCPKLW